MSEPRWDGRAADELRPLSFEVGAAPYAEGSCLVQAGRTRVLCTASVLDRVPSWREGSGAGWVTGEYGMLPRSTHTRRDRERDGAGGRTREIERLIGRALRAVTDLEALGPRTVVVDCDVLQADGGTRTASVSGGCVALARACRTLVGEGEVGPVRELVSAVSVGIVEGRPVLDLDYREDASAQVDMNVVTTEGGRLVEIQGTAEGEAFTRGELDHLLDLALSGTARIREAQRGTLTSEDGGGSP